MLVLQRVFAARLLEECRLSGLALRLEFVFVLLILIFFFQILLLLLFIQVEEAVVKRSMLLMVLLELFLKHLAS